MRITITKRRRSKINEKKYQKAFTRLSVRGLRGTIFTILFLQMIGCSSTSFLKVSQKELPEKICLSGSGKLYFRYGRSRDRISFESFYNQKNNVWTFGLQVPVYGERVINLGESKVDILNGVRQAFSRAQFSPGEAWVIRKANNAIGRWLSDLVGAKSTAYPYSSSGYILWRNDRYRLTFNGAAASKEGTVKQYTFDFFEPGVFFNATSLSVNINFDECSYYTKSSL